MSHTIKRAWGGKFVVMDADDAQVFGPASKAECLEWTGGKPPAQPAPKTGEPHTPTRAELRAWDRKVDEATRKPRDEEAAELRVLLSKRHSEDEVNYLMRQITPILAAGLQGARRERGRYRPLAVA